VKPGTAHRRRVPAATVVLGAVLAVAGCSQQVPSDTARTSPEPTISGLPHPSAPAYPDDPGPSRSPSGATVDPSDPQSVAGAFVKAFVGRRYDDPPRAFLKKVKPFTTADYLARLRQETGDGCGTACKAYIRAKSVTTASVSGTVIPPEAPRTKSSVWVQVSYTKFTKSQVEKGNHIPYGMVLHLRKQGGGWLVSERQGQV
jgi:hypothetical protein